MHSKFHPLLIEIWFIQTYWGFFSKTVWLFSPFSAVQIRFKCTVQKETDIKMSQMLTKSCVGCAHGFIVFLDFCGRMKNWVEENHGGWRWDWWSLDSLSPVVHVGCHVCSGKAGSTNLRSPIVPWGFPPSSREKGWKSSCLGRPPQAAVVLQCNRYFCTASPRIPPRIGLGCLTFDRRQNQLNFNKE